MNCDVIQADNEVDYLMLMLNIMVTEIPIRKSYLLYYGKTFFSWRLKYFFLSGFGSSKASVDGHVDNPLSVVCQVKQPQHEAVADHAVHDSNVRIADHIPRVVRGALALHPAGVSKYTHVQLHLCDPSQRGLVHRHHILAGHYLRSTSTSRSRIQSTRQCSQSASCFRAELRDYGWLPPQVHKPPRPDRLGTGVLRPGGELQPGQPAVPHVP